MKVCTRCETEKPLSEFHRRTFRNGNVGYTSDCKLCRNAGRMEYQRTEKGRELSRRVSRAYYHKLQARARSGSLSDDPVKVDAMRRALVEHPPELVTEPESLAYFRGFMAGAKRTADESERFDRLKDLCHRICSERRFWKYEDALSAAYEGLLNFIRKRGFHYKSGGYKSPEHERKSAAMAIRSAVVDQFRSDGDFSRTGARRHAGTTLSQLQDAEGSPTYAEPASQDRSQREIDFLIDLRGAGLEPRLQLILERLGAGYNLREIGEELGVTESSVCLRLKSVARQHPEWEKALLLAVAG